MSVKCHEIISAMEILAPKNLAESWDNVGLMLGSQNDNINKILFALDCSEAVIDEAIEIGANMIITHHPFIFKALKTLDFDTPIGKKIKKAINERNEDVLRYQFVNPVCKMVLRSLVTKYNIRFQEVPASNDLMFSVKSGHYAEKVKAVDKIVYVITVGEEGTSLTRTKTLKNEESRCEA